VDLKELLLSRGKTTRQAGVSKNLVIDLIHGRRSPGPTAIRKLAEALEVGTEVVYAACQESVRRASAGGEASQQGTGDAQAQPAEQGG